jgi:diguanylate cyclase (GGDEF)-like protein/PAS domain S-box-containing protein
MKEPPISDCEEEGAAALYRSRFFRDIADAMPGMIAYWGKDLRCRFANRTHADWFGQAPEDIVGQTMQSVLGERLFAYQEQHVLAALAGERRQFEGHLTKSDGTVGYGVVNYIPDIDSAGRVAGFFALLHDVTPIKMAEVRQREPEARLRAILDNILDGIVVIDANGTILSVNPSAARIFGYRQDELAGQNVKILMPQPDRREHDGHLARYRDGKKTRIIGQGRELEGMTRDGRTFPMELTVTEVAMDGQRLFTGVVRDITERKLARDHLNRLATTDGLTHLANRRRFDEVLAAEWARHGRSGGPLSLILLDVDQFKQFNDSYGHLAGDDCLRQVADAVAKAIIRGTDLAARYGGEEFACILPNTDQAGALKVAQRILDGINRLAIPHDRSNVAAHVTVSIGLVTVGGGYSGAESHIIEKADEQLYAAKSGGRNRICAACYE